MMPESYNTMLTPTDDVPKFSFLHLHFYSMQLYLFKRNSTASERVLGSKFFFLKTFPNAENKLSWSKITSVFL